MKKGIIVVACICLACLMLSLAAAYMENPDRFSFGDRISGTFFLKDHPTDSSSGSNARKVYYTFVGKTKEAKCYDFSYSLKGDEYGKYRICFEVNSGDLHKGSGGELWLEKDLLVYVNYFKSNRWEFVNLDVTGSVYQEEGIWYIEMTADDGTQSSSKKEVLDLSNPIIELQQVGP